MRLKGYDYPLKIVCTISMSDEKVKDGVKHDGQLAESVEAKPRTKLPALADKIPCPRCNSTDTKFCYYNNYNLKQPRYLCKVVRSAFEFITKLSNPVSCISHIDAQFTILFRGIIQSCQRYWTLGGLIRQVPPGSGKRKHKNSKLADSSKRLGRALKESDLCTGNGLASVNNCASAMNFSMPTPNVSQSYLVHSYVVPHSYSGEQDHPEPE